MIEEPQPIREAVLAVLDCLPNKVTQYWKWLHPLKVVVVENECWWNIAEYQHNPVVRLNVKLMVTNFSDYQIILTEFVPRNKRITKNIFSVIHLIRGNHAMDPIIPANKTEEIKIMSVFQPVILNKFDDLELKSILKNSIGRPNKTSIHFKSVEKR